MWEMEMFFTYTNGWGCRFFMFFFVWGWLYMKINLSKRVEIVVFLVIILWICSLVKISKELEFVYLLFFNHMLQAVNTTCQGAIGVFTNVVPR